MCLGEVLGCDGEGRGLKGCGVGVEAAGWVVVQGWVHGEGGGGVHEVGEAILRLLLVLAAEGLGVVVGVCEAVLVVGDVAGLVVG